MELTNNFTVAAPIDEAWRVLLDVERVARCMPGATLEGSEGDVHKGHVKVKVGPIVVTYQGTARFVEIDEAAHRAVIDASGKESRGSGTAKATVTTTLEDRGDHTAVDVVTDLNITGRPAQFGRGVIADVAGKLTETFAQNLAAELAGTRAASAGGLSAEAAGTEPSEATRRPEAAPRPQASAAPEAAPEKEPIDLLGVSASPVLKRVGPVAGAVAALGLLLLVRRGRRRRRGVA